MKKTQIWFAAAVMICTMALFGLAGCGSSSEEAAPAEETTVEETTVQETTVQETTAQPSETQAPADEMIGEDRALEIALNDAGLSEGDVSYPNVHLDIDDGRNEYDVEFHQGNIEYNYSIDPYSGDILEKETDTDND